MNPQVRYLAVLIAAACLLFYVYSYTRVPMVTEILQTSITKLTPALLFEKQPIVIHEPIVDPMSLVNTVFKYLVFGTKTFNGLKGAALTQTTTRYTVITCPKGGVVDVFHPKYSNVIATNRAQFITFKLSANQIIILPKQWWFQVKGDCKVVSLKGI